jgi:hypothetical protein
MYFFVLCASALVFAFVLAGYLRSGFASAFHPISVYLAFHGWVFVIRPFFAWFWQYRIIYEVYGFEPSLETKITVIVAANLGLLAFIAGAWRTGGMPLAFRQGPAALAHRRRLLTAFLPVVAVLGLIGVASLWSSYTLTVWTMRSDTANGITINTTANGWFVEAQLLLVPISVLLAWLLRFRWYSLLPLVGFVLLRSGTGGRGPFVVACFAAALLWLFDRRQKWPSPRIVAVALALLGLFYLVGQDRGASVKALLNQGEVIRVEKRWDFVESMDWANLEFFEYVATVVPRQTGTYGYFIDNLQVFTEPIPRKYWKDKPVGAPIKMFNLFSYGKPVGMTYSLPGYGWAQGGYLGVIVWCGLWGLALGAIYTRFARSRQGTFAVAAYFAFLPIFVIAFRDGQLLTILRTGVFYLAPVALWYLAARALGIPEARVPVPAVRRSGIDPTPARRRVRSDDIVPRAWRRRPPVQPAE